MEVENKRTARDRISSKSGNEKMREEGQRKARNASEKLRRGEVGGGPLWTDLLKSRSRKGEKRFEMDRKVG